MVIIISTIAIFAFLVQHDTREPEVVLGERTYV